jgi:hypothetical protein
MKKNDERSLANELLEAIHSLDDWKAGQPCTGIVRVKLDGFVGPPAPARIRQKNKMARLKQSRV